MAAASSSVMSSVVIKVKYEDTLMRFRVQIINGELSLTASELREKIITLFGFSSDSGIMLTYVDEDGDTVTIVDSADLSDVVNQCLNPIRFSVEPVSENDSRKFNPSRSPSRRRSDLPCENDNEKKISLPDPTLETLERLIDDLISKYGIVHIADHLSIVFESVSERAQEEEEKHNSLWSFDPLYLHSSVSFDPLTFLSHEHSQQHRRRFGNAKESVNTFPYYPPPNTFHAKESVNTFPYPSPNTSPDPPLRSAKEFMNAFTYPPFMSVTDGFIDPMKEIQLMQTDGFIFPMKEIQLMQQKLRE